MVRIFSDSEGSEFVVQSTATTCEEFVGEFAEALHVALRGAADDGGLAALGILKNAMPIAFKLSGYKAEQVQEQRTLVCGYVAPDHCKVIGSAGR